MDKDGKKSHKTATYTYDLLGRIQKETKTGSEDISYTYDSNNNRKEMRVGNKVTAYKYNKNDELLRTDTLNTDTEEDSVVIYKNDKNGNQLATVNRYEIPSDKKDSAYVDLDVTLGDNRLNENVVNHYNALNQLTQTLTKNYKVSFTYDAGGLRTSKTVNGEKTVFVWDGDQLVLELSAGGKVQRRYVRGNDRGYGSNLVYSDRGEDRVSGREDGKLFYVTDPHGNVVQLTDENGAVVRTYEYDSFGNEVNPDGKDDNPFRYCGEYYDKETGEVYLRARYYQPTAGRFLTRDTYTGEEDDPLSLHLYTYCGNDGVNAWDPSGNAYIEVVVFSPINSNVKPIQYRMRDDYLFERQKASKAIKELIKNYEQPPKSAEVYSKKGKLKGYTAYNVGDGGLTYGYGHYVKDNDIERKNETKKYIKNDYLSIKNANRLFEKDIKVSEKAINKYIKRKKKYHIQLTQYEFDALIMERFLSGHLNEDILKILKKGNRNRNRWKKAFLFNKNKASKYYNGWKNRAEDQLEVFFDNEYERNH